MGKDLLEGAGTFPEVGAPVGQQTSSGSRNFLGSSSPYSRKDPIAG